MLEVGSNCIVGLQFVYFNGLHVIVLCKPVRREPAPQGEGDVVEEEAACTRLLQYYSLQLPPDAQRDVPRLALTAAMHELCPVVQRVHASDSAARCTVRATHILVFAVDEAGNLEEPACQKDPHNLCHVDAIATLLPPSSKTLCCSLHTWRDCSSPTH